MNAINGNNTRQYSSDPDIDRLYQEDLDMQSFWLTRKQTF